MAEEMEMPEAESEPESPSGYDGELMISADDLPAGINHEVGQVIPFKVIANTDDGQISLKCAAVGESGDWEGDLRKEMGSMQPESKNMEY